MLLKNIDYMEKVGNAIERCKGDVYLRLDDNTQRSLKEDPFLLQTIRKMKLGEEGLDLRFQNRDDLMRFMNEVYNTYQV